MTAEIDFSGPVPINEQIAELMRDNIFSGEWPKDYKLKSETDLSELYNVSRGTIRKAIEILIDEGLLVRIHGRGTFVKTNILLEQSPNGRIAGFSRDLLLRGIPFSTDIQLAEVIHPPPHIAKILLLKPDEYIFHLKRLRKILHRPVLVIENHLNYQLCEGVEKINFSKEQLYTTLESKFGIQFDWARRTYKAQIADENLAKILNIRVGSPVMYLEELYHVVGDVPVEFTKAWANADIFHITTRINRRDEKRDGYGLNH